MLQRMEDRYQAQAMVASRAPALATLHAAAAGAGGFGWTLFQLPPTGPHHDSLP
jgi:hypothetical protein